MPSFATACIPADVCMYLSSGQYEDQEDVYAAVSSHCERCLSAFLASPAAAADEGALGEAGGRRLRQLPSLVTQFASGEGCEEFEGVDVICVGERANYRAPCHDALCSCGRDD